MGGSEGARIADGEDPPQEDLVGIGGGLVEIVGRQPAVEAEVVVFLGPTSRRSSRRRQREMVEDDVELGDPDVGVLGCWCPPSGRAPAGIDEKVVMRGVAQSC